MFKLTDSELLKLSKKNSLELIKKWFNTTGFISCTEYIRLENLLNKT